MSGGNRSCYFKATIQVGTRWYCRKCHRKLISRRSKPAPKIEPKQKSRVINPAGHISDQDLQKLYKNVKRYQESGGTVDVYSSKVLVNEILPSLLLEVMRLRGIEPPEE